jgi:hypothetical protein
VGACSLFDPDKTSHGPIACMAGTCGIPSRFLQFPLQIDQTNINGSPDLVTSVVDAQVLNNAGKPATLEAMP